MALSFFLIDDDDDDRELFFEALKEVDGTVLFDCQNDARAALDRLNNEDLAVPNVVFLDANLPKMSGWECLQFLKASPTTSHIPVIMYSTSSYQRDIDRSVSMGAIWFFTKPDSFEGLKRLLTIVIACIKNNSFSSLSR